MNDRFKIFTLEEAERTLPLVRRVVQDLIAEYPRWRAAVTHFEMLSGAARAHDDDNDDLMRAQDAVMRHADRINAFLGELEHVGCVFKGFENGLVDFYALSGDRLVFLCWMLGEDRISYWHEVDAGFTGRQPLDPALLPEPTP